MSELINRITQGFLKDVAIACKVSEVPEMSEFLDTLPGGDNVATQDEIEKFDFLFDKHEV